MIGLLVLPLAFNVPAPAVTRGVAPRAHVQAVVEAVDPQVAASIGVVVLTGIGGIAYTQKDKASSPPAPVPAATPQHPGWIWDSQSNQWVADPNYRPPQQ